MSEVDDVGQLVNVPGPDGEQQVLKLRLARACKAADVANARVGRPYVVRLPGLQSSFFDSCTVHVRGLGVTVAPVTTLLRPRVLNGSCCQVLTSSGTCVAGRSAITASGDSAGFDVDGEHDVAWVRARAQVAAIRSGNVQMFFPECNLLIRAGERDASGVPDYNAVVEVLPAS